MTLTFGSLFAGIGGFDLGLERAGMVCKWQVEIDDKCNTVLAHHWPDTARLGDVNDVGRRNLEPVDLVCGGFPCQDLSVAGKREGLSGERSGLWFEFHRVLAELKPRWTVIENVPGLLSSNGGQDFAVLLRGLAELGYGACWRVLDAQYFGVAQRRRRVFLIGSLGDGRAAEVLFEREGGCWDSAPSREAGQELARDVAASLRSRGDGTGTRIDNETGLVCSDVSRVLTGCKTATERLDPNEQEFIVSQRSFSPHSHYSYEETEQASPIHDLHRRFSGSDILTVTGEQITPTLKGGRIGWCGSEDGTGRGTPIVAYGVSENQRAEMRLTEYSRQITGGGGKPGQEYPCIAFRTNQTKAQGPIHSEELTDTLAQDHPPAVAFAERTRADGRNLETQDELAYALANPGSGGTQHSRRIAGAFGIRRLTVRECERLQGFPDDWTFVNGMSDSARYRMLGNAVAVPVAEWLGRRILEVEAMR